MEVWKRGCRLAVEIYRTTADGPWERDWGFRDQLRRASVSIPSNLAEGFERGSRAEFKRFALIAKGSCGELRTQIYISQEIGYLPKPKSESLIGECLEISYMLSALIKQLKTQSGKPE